jgi:hypothetical protein
MRKYWIGWRKAKATKEKEIRASAKKGLEMN